ncbi:MAG: inorganic phosphate transporter [Candidatus Thorarchaeota archaeon]
MDPLVIVLLILMVVLSFGIGANDETMATLVGSRVIKTKYVIGLAAILVFIGVVFLSENVGRTIGENLLGESVEYNVYMLFAVIISTTIWLVIASITGAPISTTHSVVGAVFGVAFVWSFQKDGTFLSSMNWGKLGQVALGWVLSPILGMIGAITFRFLIEKILSKLQKGLERTEKIERIFGFLLIGIIGWTQISRGGNDSANALGIMYGLIESGQFSAEHSIYLVLAVGIVLASGLVIIGKNVIKNVGNNLIAIKPSDAVSIELSTSIVIFLATILGFPISGSHVLIFSVVGAGIAKGERPERKTFIRIVLSWIITFPIAAILSGIIYGIFLGAIPSL